MFVLIAVLVGSQIWKSVGFPLETPFSLPKNASAANCLLPILLQSRPLNVFLVCRKNATFCPRTILNHFPGTSWTILDNVGTMSDDVRTDDVCVIATEENDTQEILAEVGECHRARIILMFPSDSVPVPIPDKYEPFFRKAWQIGLVDIVIMVSERSDCYAYIYAPFQPNGNCNDTSPVLRNSWKSCEKLAVHTKVSFFPEDRASNLHHCDFFVTVMLNDPVIINHYHMIYFLEKALNSTHQFARSDDSELSNTVQTFRGAVALNGAITPTTLKHYDPSFFMETMEVLLVIPIRPISSVGWSRLLNELSSEAWYGVLVCLTVSVVAFCVFFKSERVNYGYVLLFTISPLFSASCPNRPFRWQVQMYFGFWLMYCFTLDSIYLCTLKSKLIVPFSDDAIKTFSDFAKLDIKVHVPADKEKFMNLWIPPKSPYGPLIEKIVYVNDVSWNVFADKLKDTAYLVVRDEYEWWFVDNTSYRIIPDEVIFRSPGLALMVPRPSPFQRRFNTMLLRAAGAGAMALDERRRLRDILSRKRRAESLEPTTIGALPLTLNSLLAIFGLLLLGWFFGLLVFVAERVHSRLHIPNP